MATGWLAEGVVSHCSQSASLLSLRFIIFPCFGQDSEHIDSGGGEETGSPRSGVLVWAAESPTPPSRSLQV